MTPQTRQVFLRTAAIYTVAATSACAVAAKKAPLQSTNEALAASSPSKAAVPNQQVYTDTGLPGQADNATDTGRIADLGYAHLPRAMVDVNRDGIKDYCRVVGDAPSLFIACKLAKANGFTSGDEYAYRSIPGIDLGYDSLPRYFADVNGDALPDFCRFVGNEPDVMLSCNLGTASGFSTDQYGFNSVPKLDRGYPWFRALADVDGDGRADFCRFVGDNKDVFLSCNLATTNGFAASQYGFNSIQGIDRGYDELPRTLIDRNGDGRADYCRYVGNRPDVHLSCDLAQIARFDANQYGLNFPTDQDAFYNHL